MIKRSKNKRKDLNFYFSIVEYIKNTNRLPKEKYTGMKKQNLNYYIKKLKIDEIIHKKGYGVWEVDTDKYEQLKFSKEVKKRAWHTRSPKTLKTISPNLEIRGHAFNFTVEIPYIEQWDKIRKEVQIRRSGVYINNGKVVSFNFRGRIIWLCKKSIVVYFNKEESFYGETARDGKKNAIYILKSILTGIERLISQPLRINKEYQFKVSKQEYSHVKDVLAKDFNDRNEKFRCYHNGKLWLLVDKSFNEDEFEGVDAKRSDKDMDNVVMPIFNDARDYNLKTGETLTLSALKDMIGDIQKEKLELVKTVGCLANVYKMDLEDRKKKLEDIKPIEETENAIREYTG